MRLWQWVVICSGLVLASSSQSLAITLADVARETIATNPEVLSSAANRNARASEVYEAVGLYLPHVSTRAAGGRQQSTNPTVKAQEKDSITLNRSEFGVNARQLIVDGWGVGSTIRERVYDSRSAKYQLRDVCDNVILEVSEAFLNVRRQREILAYAKHNVAVHQEIRHKVELSYRGGAGTRADAALAQSRLARAQAQESLAQARLDDAITRFCTVSGRVPPADLAMPLQPSVLLPRNLYTAVAIAMDNSPTILSSASTAEAAGARVGVAKARFFPRLDAEFSATANNNLDGVEGVNGDMRGMAVLNYDIISGGSDIAAYNAAKADRIKAERKTQEIQRKVKERVRNAWTEWTSNRERVMHFRENVDAELRVVSDYRKQFELGQRQLFNVLDAEDDLYNAQNSLVNAQYDSAVAYYRILETIGMLNLKSLI